jgi:hypothetical protein
MATRAHETEPGSPPGPEPAIDHQDSEGWVAPSLEPSAGQVAYASWLEKGMLIGLGLLLLTYLLYVSGAVSPYIPMSKLQDYWSQDVEHYLHETGVQTGWGWIRLAGHGDFLCFFAIAILASVTILCYMRTVPIFLRRGDRIYALLALLQVIVLCIAASGILGTGGH